MPSVADRHGFSTDLDRIVIEHGVRRTVVRLPRHGVLVFGFVLLLLAGWSLGTAAYLVFYDTVVAQLRHGASASARGYEAQLAALRDELERTRTRRLVEKAGVDERLSELGLRQAAIEKRQTRLMELADAGVAASPERDPDVTYSLKPRPMDAIAPVAEPEPEAAQPGAGPLRASALQSTEKVSVALDAVEAGQTRALEGLGAKTTERRRTLERVYDAARVKKPGVGDGRARGGPFEPMPPRAMTFDARVDQIAAERAIVGAFERGLARVPVRTPAPGSPVSSGFGTRTDPFLGRLAFHGGIDFECEYGDTVKATAAGRVTSAGWSGGYGNMVEIDHGGGLVTRFGHLSAILVREGDEVKIGSALGRVGSTGRSTGPHLHYETRVDGDAVDPIRFLNAGRILAAK